MRGELSKVVAAIEDRLLHKSDRQLSTQSAHSLLPWVSGLTSDQDKLMLMEVGTEQWSELATGQDIEYPNWSRDSQNLFFESTVNGERVLFRVNVSTRRTERVLSLAGIRRPSVPFGVQWSGLRRLHSHHARRRHSGDLRPHPGPAIVKFLRSGQATLFHFYELAPDCDEDGDIG